MRDTCSMFPAVLHAWSQLYAAWGVPHGVCRVLQALSDMRNFMDSLPGTTTRLEEEIGATKAWGCA